MNSSDLQNKFLGKRELNGLYNSNLKKKRKKKENGNTFTGTLVHGLPIFCFSFDSPCYMLCCSIDRNFESLMMQTLTWPKQCNKSCSITTVHEKINLRRFEKGIAQQRLRTQMRTRSLIRTWKQDTMKELRQE